MRAGAWSVRAGSSSKGNDQVLNRTTVVGRLAVQDEMESKLDRVTPFAKRDVAYEQASSSKLSAAVIIAGKS